MLFNIYYAYNNYFGVTDKFALVLHGVVNTSFEVKPYRKTELMKNILLALVLIFFTSAAYSNIRPMRSLRYRLDEPTGAAPVVLNLFLKEAMCLQGDI